MTTAAVFLVVAFALGLLARLVTLPPLLGFLLAGFLLQSTGRSSEETVAALGVLAQMGVALLLFGIGLKLEIGQLARREVFATATLHTALMAGIGTGFLGLLAALGMPGVTGLAWSTLALLALALSFSSTVFVVKILEERSALRSRYGQVAIGILVIQDIIAVVLVALGRGAAPSPWALAVLLLLPARPLLRRIWTGVGHGELQVLFGLSVALIPGYLLFDAVGLGGDLGAIAVGMLLASDPRADELSKSIFAIKEVLLVAFFLGIGLNGIPTLAEIGLAVVLLLLLPLQTFAYLLLVSWFGMRRRTATLTALALANNSEFGLIVAAESHQAGLIGDTWVTTLAVAVAAGFVLAGGVNTRAERIADWTEAHWRDPSPERLDPHERPIPLHDIDALVLGMGRVGHAAYLKLAESGLRVLGIEHDEERAESLDIQGCSVIPGDATDSELWRRLRDIRTLQVTVLAMPFHQGNLAALEVLRARHFTGPVTAVVFHDDDAEELVRHGADHVVHLYGGAGTALAEAALGDVTEPGTFPRHAGPST